MDVRFSATTSELIDSLPIVNGQIIALSDQSGYFYDMGDTRYQISGVLCVDMLPDHGVENLLYCLKEADCVTLWVWVIDKFIPMSQGIIKDSETALNSTFSSNKIMQLIDAIHQFLVVFVDELPEVGDEHTIYFTNRHESQGQNIYDEWMYINGGWEKIGDTYVKVNIATTSEPGVVKPDGSSISLLADGTISTSADIVPFSSAVGVAAHNVKDGIDEVYSSLISQCNQLQQQITNHQTSIDAINEFVTTVYGLVTALRSEFDDLTADVKKIRKVTELPEEPQDDTLYLIP